MRVSTFFGGLTVAAALLAAIIVTTQPWSVVLWLIGSAWLLLSASALYLIWPRLKKRSNQDTVSPLQLKWRCGAFVVELMIVSVFLGLANLLHPGNQLSNKANSLADKLESFSHDWKQAIDTKQDDFWRIEDKFKKLYSNSNFDRRIRDIAEDLEAYGVEANEIRGVIPYNDPHSAKQVADDLRELGGKAAWKICPWRSDTKIFTN